VVRFAAPPADADTLRRRLSMLASAFADLLPNEPRSRASRPPPSRSLGEELAALVKRTRAADALVIDAHSPVVWGAAGAGGELEGPTSTQTLEELRRAPPPRPSGLRGVNNVIPLYGADWERDAVVELPASEPQEPSQATPEQPPVSHKRQCVMRALLEVRELPDLAALKRGGHLRQMVGEPGFGYVARSFAAIYVLVVVFDAPYEELLVKRAIAQALPIIERLVAALPPLDPRPTAGVAALRPRRRR
jgi:hypothetical protein